MSKPNRSLRFFFPATFVAALLAASCILDLSGPGGGIGYFALAPAFPSGSDAVVDVDSVHVVLRRTSDNTVALDTAFSTTPSDTIDLSLRVVLKAPAERFWLVLECFDPAGNLVFAAGPIEVTATTSSGDVVAQNIQVAYVGVGHDAWDADVPGSDIYYIQMGDTLTLQAVALDSSGAPIPGTPIKWASYDTTRVIFPDRRVGRMQARQLRGWAKVAAELLTGQNDIVDVYVEPVPSQITISSGNNQTGAPGAELPVVLEVQVDAPDGPVEGFMVDFTTQGGGSFGQASMATDAQGRAWTRWTLGPGAGQQTATASVRDYPGLLVTFTATSVAPPATVSWINANGGNWSEPSNWSTGTVPTAVDTVEIDLDGEYMVTLDTDATVDVLRIGTVAAADLNLNIDGTTLTVTSGLVVGGSGTVQLNGTLTGTGWVHVDGRFDWNLGTVSTEGLFEVSTTGSLYFDLPGQKTLDGTHATNAGLVEWYQGNIELANQALVDNLETGFFGAYAKGSLTGWGMHNWGVFEKDGPDSTIVLAGLENFGTLNVGAGWLVLGGDFWHLDGALLRGLGTLDLVNANIVSFTGDIGPGESPGILTVAGNLPLNAASTVFIELDGTTSGSGYDVLDVNGALQAAGNLSVVTSFTPTPGDRFTVLSFGSRTGDFSNVTGLDLGSGLTLEPQWNANSLELVATGAQAGGTIAWLSNFVDTDWSNPANWDLGRAPSALDTVQIVADVSVAVQLANDATVARLELGGPTNANTQELNVQPGMTLRIDSSATVETSGRLIVREATLTGSGNLVSRGDLYNLGGTMVGPGSTNIEVGGRFLIGAGLSGITSEFDGRLIWNNGQIEWSGGNLELNNGAQILNNAYMDIRTGNYWMGYGGVGTPGSLVNNGTLRRTTNTDMTLIQVPLTSNSTSSLQVLSGTIVLQGGSSFNDAAIEVGDAGASASLMFTDSTHVIDALSMVTVGPSGFVQFIDAAVTIDGSYDYTGAAAGITDLISGSVAFNGSTTVIPHLYVADGTLSTSTSVLVATSMGWSGGTLAGTGSLRINPGSTLALTGSSYTLDGLDIDNRGTTVWYSGSLTGLNGPQFLNDASATFEMFSDGTWGGTGTFQNDGTLRYIGTTMGTFGWALTNAGTLDAVGPSGILRLIGDFTHQDGAVIQGSGSIDYTAANVLGWDGNVNPGGTGNAGTLNLMGNALPSALSTANIELGGLTAGTEYDRVAVNGNFTADGTLDVSIINGFIPLAGQTFTVLTFTGTRTGDFASYMGTDLGGGLMLEPQWNATSLDLLVTQPPPAQILFAGDSAYGLSTGIFTVNPDGTGLTHPHSMASLGSEEIYPRWSPNSERIAFNNRISGAESVLYMMYATGDTLVSVVTDTSTFVPRWSPNGTHLAFECGDGWSEIDVCVIGDVTGALSTLANIGNGGGKVYVTDFDPVDWPDGPWVFTWDPLNHDRIAVVRDSIPPTGGTGQSMIFTMLYNGTNVQRLLPTGVLDAGNGPLRIIGGPDDQSMGGNLDWSPDGQWLIFSAVDPTGQQNIYRINRDGSNLITLTATTDDDDGPMWSPSGSEILFGRDIGGSCDIDMWIMNADGSGGHQITAEHVCDYPMGRLGADWSPNGQQIALTGFESPGSNLFIYVIPRTTTDATYFVDRAVVGPLRGQGAASFEVVDIQPSWRP